MYFAERREHPIALYFRTESDLMNISLVTRPLPGERENGDAFLVAVLDREKRLTRAVTSISSVEAGARCQEHVTVDAEEKALVAVVDGTGHGTEAAKATATIVNCMKKNYAIDLVSIVRACHECATFSRGAALGLLFLDIGKSAFEYVGIGNIELIIATTGKKRRRRVSAISIWPSNPDVEISTFVSNNGIVGHNLPEKLLTFTHEFTPTDIIEMHSDGIPRKFDLRQLPNLMALSPFSIADAMIAEFARNEDDATTMVAKCDPIDSP